MKIYVNRMPVRGPWGGGAHFINAAYDIIPDFGHVIEAANNSNSSPDLILLVGTGSDGSGISAQQAIMYKSVMSQQRDVKIVIRVNENDARKGTQHVDKELIEISKHVDGTIFVSEWLKNYFINRGWCCQNNVVIKNGVNKEIFQPQQKLNNGKINLVTHHWSDNYLKGFDIYDEVDNFLGTEEGSGYTFTYIGRDRGTFKRSSVIKPLHGKKLGEELGKYDVYISASRFDPGPNHVIESVSCQIPTYVHVEGGGSVEFAGEKFSYSSWKDLKQILLNKKFERNEQNFDDWKTCMEKCVRFFEGIVKNERKIST